MDISQEELYKIILAVIIGALIGGEREYHNKSAGFRTLMLITLGSTLFTILSSRMTSPNQDRIASNIVTGIGFLGAGAIFKDDNRVNGLTTAATIWAAAALGMSIGWGEYALAMGGTLLILVILTALLYVEQRIDARNRIRKYRISFAYKEQSLSYYESLFKELGLKAERGTQSRIGEEIIGNWMVSGTEANHERAIQKLLSDKEVKEFDF
jgi:putative Mg2+ transporter-C (MgtC) family protein